MFSDKLECLQQSDRFIHTSTDRKVVHRRLFQNSVRIDEKKSSKGNSYSSNVKPDILQKFGYKASRTSFFIQDTVATRDGFIDVSNNGDIHFTKSTLFTWKSRPSEMTFGRIRRASNQLGIQCLEFVRTVTKSNNLSGADKRPILFLS